MKHLNEYTSAESEKYEEKGLEGVPAKEVLMNAYPETLLKLIKDFDSQCDDSSEFKNKNLSMLRDIITFYVKYHGTVGNINPFVKKYNIK